jgi:hypothetical protein
LKRILPIFLLILFIIVSAVPAFAATKASSVRVDAILSDDGTCQVTVTADLSMDKIFDILREPKANQQDKISFRVDDLRKFFPKSYSAARIQETILKLLSDYQKKRQRDYSR